jgi:hypothetical protein
MNENRLTDEQIATHLADAKVGAEIRGHGCELSQTELVAALGELQSHRARNAAHAAAHPERLSDNYLANRAAHIDCMTADGESTDALISQRRADERRAIAEIQHRRAADLTPEELETVREMLAEFEANDMGWENGCEDVVAVCRKILRAHGATP